MLPVVLISQIQGELTQNRMGSENVYYNDLGNTQVFRGDWRSLLSLAKKLIRGMISPYKYIWRGSSRKKNCYLGKRWCCDRGKGAEIGHVYVRVRRLRSMYSPSEARTGNLVLIFILLLSFLCNFFFFDLFVEC